MKKFVCLFVCLFGLVALTSCKQEPTLSLSQNPLEVPTDGGVFTIEVSSNCAWVVESKELKVSPLEGVNNGSVQISIPANNTSIPRSYAVKFTATNDLGVLSQTLDINQLSLEKSITASIADPSAIDPDGGEIILQVNATEDWGISSESTDIKFNPESGFAGANTVAVTLPANSTNDPINYVAKLSLLSSSDIFAEVSIEQKPHTEITYAGEIYSVRWLAGSLWMTQPLRYVPEGKTPSDTPSDNSGVWYPYSLEVTYSINPKTGKETASATASPLTDAESVKKIGYLYSANVYLGGVEYGVENFTTFEGVQGICPEGWHIPTKGEWVALFGYAQSGGGASEIEVADAPMYYKEYQGGLYKKGVECGWNPVLSGAVANGKYNTTAVHKLNSTLEDLHSLPGFTYFASSTGVSEKQLWGGMTTFSLAKYPEGRFHVSFNTATNGVQVRCVRDAK